MVTDIKSNVSQASKRFAPVNQAGNAQNVNVTPGMMPRRKSTASELTLLKKKPKLDAKKLLEEFEQGKTDFAQEDLSGLNLQKAHIPGIIFYQAQLHHANLQGADLTQANLGKANLSQGIFKNANLCQAYMSYANLERADLRGADLTGANLNYASLRGANLCGANLCDAKVTPEQLALAKVNWLTVMPSGKRGFW
jgi:serine/threonine-protein kinase